MQLRASAVNRSCSLPDEHNRAQTDTWMDYLLYHIKAGVYVGESLMELVKINVFQLMFC